jgi:uncharacterized protein YndB with AHSA1/START domain
VWRALTDPFTFRGEPTPWWDGVVRCEVLEVEPHKRLRYTWRGGSGAASLDTVVTWTLTETPSGGPRLVLEHTGFAPGDGFALQGATQGRQRNLGERLRDLLSGLEET